MLVPCAQHKPREINMTNASALKLFAAVACVSTAMANAAPLQYTFHAIVNANGNGIGSATCISTPSLSTCGSDAPPIGVPLTIVVLLDAHQPPQAEGNAPYPGTTTRYDMVGPSTIDFGYRPEFRFSDFYLRVVDNNVGNSAPDRLYVIRNQRPVYRQVPEAWFNIEFDSPSISFLTGTGLPTSLDLSLTTGGEPYFGPPHGTIFISFNGVTSQASSFVITGVEVSQPVPELSTFAMMLAGVSAVGVAYRRRKSR